MNPTTKEIIEQCTRESHAGKLTFPEVLGKLVAVGVESYFVDYRDQSTTYYFSHGDALRIAMTTPSIDIPNVFNKEVVVSAIRGAQNDQIRYPDFLKLTMSAGCMGYIAWITGRHVNYFGRQGEVHVELFPEQ